MGRTPSAAPSTAAVTPVGSKEDRRSEHGVRAAIIDCLRERRPVTLFDERGNVDYQLLVPGRIGRIVGDAA